MRVGINSKVVENEAATAVCRKLLRLDRPSHADLNKVICNSLVGALAPAAATTETQAGGVLRVRLGALGGGEAHYPPTIGAMPQSRGGLVG